MKNGLILLKPTTVDKTGAGSTATISTLGSVEFGSCETLSLNGVFSADYDNYMIVMRMVNAGSGVAVDVRMRASGTDANSGYTSQYVYASSTSVVGLRSSGSYGELFFTDSEQRDGAVAYIYGPHLAQATAMRSVGVCGENGAFLIDFVNTHSTASSYDGITFLSRSSTLSGRVAVYGMRK